MDAKWLVISNRSGVKPGIVSAIAWELFDYASQNDERGSINGFDVEIYAAFSGFSEDEISVVINAMREKNVIDSNNYLTNWVKRQPVREDDSRERVTKFREMKRSVTQCNAPDKIKNREDKDTDKEQNRTELPPRPSIFSIYEREIGPLTPIIADELILAEKDYPEGWVEAALKEASLNNKRNWAYTRGILRRCQAEGRPPGKRENIPKDTFLAALEEARNGN